MQYFIRPLVDFEQFADQVSGLVDTARDYKCGLAVFPEYFTLQLMTLGDTLRNIVEQVRVLASHGPRYFEVMRGLAEYRGG
jgi:hypothetical protein